MNQITQIYEGAPQDILSREEREQACYSFLNRLEVPFFRVDHPAADTIEKCEEIEKVIGVGICKNLFLCNRQKTEFYLLMMDGRKSFRTADVSKKLGVSRLSFAGSDDMLRLLNVYPGSVSVLALMNDIDHRVRLVIDRDVLAGEYVRCHPCKNTSTLKIKTTDFLGKILPALHRNPIVTEV